MKILFIGGTGNISSTITRMLAEAGHEVDLLNRAKTSKYPLPKGAKVIAHDAGDVRGWGGGGGGRRRPRRGGAAGGAARRSCGGGGRLARPPRPARRAPPRGARRRPRGGLSRTFLFHKRRSPCPIPSPPP